MRDPLPPPRRGSRLVVALGHPLRRDDGVGLEVASRLRDSVSPATEVVEVDDPLSLIDRWAGAELVIAVDAVRSGAPPGTLHQLEATTAPLPAGWSFGSSHQVGLAHAVEIARATGRLPPRLIVVGVEAGDCSYGTDLSPAVAAAVPDAVAAVIAYLRVA